MGNRIGIIAGSGDFPNLALKEALNHGYTCVVGGIRGMAESSLEDKAEVFEWFEVDEVRRLIDFFRKNEVSDVLLAGKIDPRVAFEEGRFKNLPPKLRSSLREKSVLKIMRAVIDYLEREGLIVKDPTPFISRYYCEEGILTGSALSPEVREDIEFGWKRARSIADLDIGQAVIIKDKTVVAVEGLEGTNEAIKRGGMLAGEGIVVVKVCRTLQDSRVDLPAVGLETIKALVGVKGKALCFEAGRMPFFQKEEAISVAKKNGLSVVAKK